MSDLLQSRDISNHKEMSTCLDIYLTQLCLSKKRKRKVGQSMWWFKLCQAHCKLSEPPSSLMRLNRAEQMPDTKTRPESKGDLQKRRMLFNGQQVFNSHFWSRRTPRASTSDYPDKWVLSIFRLVDFIYPVWGWSCEELVRTGTKHNGPNLGEYVF